MTDRHSGYVVVLEKAIREDDAEPILKAIQMIKGVVSVKPIVSSVAEDIAYEQAKAYIAQKVLKALTEL